MKKFLRVRAKYGSRQIIPCYLSSEVGWR